MLLLEDGLSRWILTILPKVFRNGLTGGLYDVAANKDAIYVVHPPGVDADMGFMQELENAAISMLLNDAYAFLFLANYNLYEDEDDEFVWGRAYGGSPVSSTFLPLCSLDSQSGRVDCVYLAILSNLLVVCQGLTLSSESRVSRHNHL